MSDGSFLSNEQRNRFRAIVQPYAAGLAKVGLTPNMLTLIGFGIAIAAAVLAGLDRGEELIIPDEAARKAWSMKKNDRAAYDAVMRQQATKLNQVT